MAKLASRETPGEAATPQAPTSLRRGGFLRWQWEAWRERRRNPRAAVFFEIVRHDVAQPNARAGELRVTWLGHASVLLQSGSANLLLDPILSRRASPVQWAGPERHAPPGVPLDELPPLDALLVTHDHYDHLDRLTVQALASAGAARERARRALGGAAPSSFTPLVVTPRGYRAWMSRLGVRRHRELSWWEAHELDGGRGTSRVTAVPVRHWSRRELWSRNRRLWCGYVVETGGFRVFCCGDSGYFPGFADLGERLGPFDLTILPIGAYEPRWFMAPAHMNPEEAVRAYRALGGRGLCLGVHWGTFVLTDEPLEEPPVRMRRAWEEAGLPAERLWIPRHGETRVLGEARAATVSAASAGSSGAASA